MKLCVIGDIHGNVKLHYEICKRAESVMASTLQIGDFGFYREHMALRNSDLDPDKHKFFGGNHDIYPSPNVTHNAGNYGSVFRYADTPGTGLFFVRGGFSIDRKYRRVGLDWFWDEELSQEQLDAAVGLYKSVKPKAVFTHEAPRGVVGWFTNEEVLREFGHNPATFTTRTSEALQRMFEAHQPEQWLFGHYHRSWNRTIDGTKFRCLNEYECHVIDC